VGVANAVGAAQSEVVLSVSGFRAVQLDDLEHLHAINEIRLASLNQEGTAGWQWISERQLLQEVTHEKGYPLLHRPDAEIQKTGGSIIAIEVELSLKKPFELAENLMELLRGQEYLRLKAEHDTQTAQSMSWQSRASISRSGTLPH